MTFLTLIVERLSIILNHHCSGTKSLVSPRQNVTKDMSPNGLTPTAGMLQFVEPAYS